MKMWIKAIRIYLSCFLLVPALILVFFATIISGSKITYNKQGFKID
jgi:hypothetical protein